MHIPFCDQGRYDVRCEWGKHGIVNLFASDVIIIVDVLSFTTCVDVAVGRGAIVYPYRWKDTSAVNYARQLGAELAGDRELPMTRYSLSPTSLQQIESGMKIVLPSPNGSTLACQAIKRGAAVLAGCLRNAQAVAEAAQQLGQSITVIPAGERWEDCSIRFALEDWLGAGAIIHNLRGSKSPESQTAEAAFRTHLPNLLSIIGACCSGRELTERSFAKDVELACEINISHAIPMMFKNTGCFQLQTG